MLAQPLLAHGYWGVLVKSLKNDETLYARECAQADDAGVEHEDRDAGGGGRKARMGLPLRDHGSSPPVRSRAARSQGDLIVVGTGDPSLVAADGMADRVFADWADTAEAARHPHDQRPHHRRRQRRSKSQTLGFGLDRGTTCPTEDFAGVGALQFNENALRVTVAPGPAAGDSAGRQPVAPAAAA